MKKAPALIIEDSIHFKSGQLLTEYKQLDEGIEDLEGNFLCEQKYILLSEKISKEDEEIIKTLVKKQMKLILWNLYTKGNVLLGNL